MKITVNGDIKEVTDGLTVRQYLEDLALSGPVAVEINRELCPKKQHEETALQDGDIVEIVTIVGGG